MNKVQILIIHILMFCITNIASADQEALPRRTLVLLSLGAGRENITHYDQAIQNDIVDKSDYSDGLTGSAYGISLAGQYCFGKDENCKQSVLFSVSYCQSHTDDSFAAGTESLLTKNGLMSFPRMVSATYDFDYLRVDMLYKYTFFDLVPISLAGGFSITNYFDMKVKETMSHTQLYTDPFGNTNFQEHRTKVYFGEPIDAAGIEIGCKLEAAYDIKLSSGHNPVFLRPVIGYYYPLTSLVHDSDWRVHSLYFYLSFMYPILMPAVPIM